MVEVVKRLEIIEGHGPRVRLTRLGLGLVSLLGSGLGLVGVARLGLGLDLP